MTPKQIMEAQVKSAEAQAQPDPTQLEAEQAQEQADKKSEQSAKSASASQSSEDPTANLDITHDGQFNENSNIMDGLTRAIPASSSTMSSASATPQSDVASDTEPSSSSVESASTTASDSINSPLQSFYAKRTSTASFIKSLTPARAKSLNSSYNASLSASASKEFPFTPKQMHFAKLGDQKYKLYKADPANYPKPKKWAFKGHQDYHASMMLKQQLQRLVQFKAKKHSAKLHKILQNKARAEAKANLKMITNKREFRASEHHLAMAPKAVVTDYYKQHQQAQQAKIRDTYAMQYGMANIMYTKGKFNDDQFLRVLDTIKAQTLIRKRHPEVQSVKEMNDYASEAGPIVNKNIGEIYNRKTTTPNDIINNPLLNKVNDNLNKYKEEAKNVEKQFNVQGIVSKKIDRQQGSNPTERYAQKARHQVEQYSKYTASTDPQIKKAERKLSRQSGQFAPQGYRSLIEKQTYKYRGDMILASIHTKNVAKAMYPGNTNLVNHINNNIFKARAAIIHHKPFKQYMTPKTQGVFNTYYMAKQQGVLADVHPQVQLTKGNQSPVSRWGAGLKDRTGDMMHHLNKTLHHKVIPEVSTRHKN